jgi:hypothetical protein
MSNMEATNRQAVTEAKDRRMFVLATSTFQMKNVLQKNASGKNM